MDIQNNGFKHREAYCLMWYECKCGHKERIWNSRDGVTPFIAKCPSCGNASMYHVQFESDERVIDFAPQIGSKVWDNVQRRAAVGYAIRNLEYLETQRELTKMSQQEIRNLYDVFFKDYYRDGRAPQLVTVTEAWIRKRSIKPSDSNVRLIRPPETDSLIVFRDGSSISENLIRKFGLNIQGMDYLVLEAESPIFDAVKDGLIEDAYSAVKEEHSLLYMSKTVEEVKGCFSAALSEGLEDALERDDGPRLKDLVVRRLMFAYYACVRG